MSSHREAPEIAKDPVADSTDVYAFMHPTAKDQVVLICNFIPLQQPNGGPNFYEFADDVRYEINISNTDECEADVSYHFRFKTRIRNRNTFLYNTGPIENIGDNTWNRPQTYTVTRVRNGRSRVIARDLPVPPCNVGVRSTPNYQRLNDQAVKTVGRRTFFAGQRSDAFHVDLGSIFDLAGLRPFNEAHVISQPTMGGVNAVQSYNVHSIALQVPARELTRDRTNPSGDTRDRKNVIGVWSSASRRAARVFSERKAKYVGRGPWVQVSRLGNPLFNEVIVPMSEKDSWNASEPKDDSDYSRFVNKPELQGLISGLYPTAFPMLAKYNKPRADLNAILLTGIPAGVVSPTFQNYTGPVEADILRLNMAVPPAAKESEFGILGGDLAGFPNGRRLGDDVVAIELRAVAGATIPLVDKTYVPDAAAAGLEDGTDYTGPALLTDFPFIGLPGGGYQTIPGTTSVA